MSVPCSRSKQVRWVLPFLSFPRMRSGEKPKPNAALWPWAIIFLFSSVFCSPAANCQVFSCPHEGHLSLADYGDDFVGATLQVETIWEPALTAAASNYWIKPPGFGSGAIGFARHYWVGVADNVNGKLMSKFVFAAASKREDCYQPVAKTGFWRGIRIAALHSIYTDGTDSFEWPRWSNFNWSGAPASLVSAGLSNAYQPGSQRTWKQTSIRWAENFGGHAGSDAGSQALADWKAWTHRTLRFLLRTHPVLPPS